MATEVFHHWKYVFTRDESIQYYDVLRALIAWEPSIATRFEPGKPTRLAKAMSLGDEEIMDRIIAQTFARVDIQPRGYHGIYINYYRDGDDWCPRHKHPGTVQLVISFGAKRQFSLEDKRYNVKGGDVIMFGSQIHGVVRNKKIKDGRISIAMFLEF